MVVASGQISRSFGPTLAVLAALRALKSVNLTSIAGLLEWALKTSYCLPAVADNQPGKNKNRMKNRADYLERFAARLSRQIAGSASMTPFNSSGEQTKSELADRSSTATPWADFDEFALELFELQFESNLAYRRFCESRRCRPGEITDVAQNPSCSDGRV